jgi:hypothetical protein
MFGAFIRGFMSFIGMYAAYKVVKSGVLGNVAESLKEKIKPEDAPSDRWGKH